MDRNDREDRSERERATPGGTPGQAPPEPLHEPLGPGNGTRTGGSAGTASGHDPMPNEVEELHRKAEPPLRRRTQGDGAGTV